MENVALRQIEKWFKQFQKDINNGFARVDAHFEQADKRFEQADQYLVQLDARLNELDGRFEKRYQQYENRFAAILNFCANLRKDNEVLFEKYDGVAMELRALTKELRDFREEFKLTASKHDLRISALEVAVEALQRRFNH